MSRIFCLVCRTSPGFARRAVGLAFCLLALPFTAVRAEPLPEADCAALRAEEALLEGGGAATNFDRGPEWAKLNLTAEQTKYVERLIGVRESLLFRCRATVVVPDAPRPVVAPEKAPLPRRKPAVAAARLVKTSTGTTTAPGRPDNAAPKKTPAAVPVPMRRVDEGVNAPSRPALRPSTR
ncbi:MAG: hypothetical protein KDJ37_08585 [Hyphomicrobiaceae bacterium]|nr:hypothetical protein [Hyphomicrobiaceae bacterium]